MFLSAGSAASTSPANRKRNGTSTRKFRSPSGEPFRLIRGEASLRTWLYRVAHNVALTYRRKQRRHVGVFESRDPAELTRRPALQPDAAADDRWLALRSAIFELGPGDRQLMLLHLEGLSLAEIESVSGIRAGTVATRLSRLRVRLSGRLRGEEARP